MGATIRTLLDENDDFIYPKTKTVAVYDENDNTLDNIIEDISDDVAELETNLGDPSSASSVTGADAFSKISTLNSDLASTNTTVNTLSLKAGNNAGTGYQTYGVGDSLADTVTSTVIPWIKRDGSTESGVFGWMWLSHGYFITIYAYVWEGSNKILMLLTKSASGQTFEDSRTVAV